MRFATIYEGAYGLAINADARDVLPLLNHIKFDAIITDPPFLPQTEKFMKKNL